MQQVYCGLDFHKNISEMCFVDSTGKILERARLTHSKALLLLSNRAQIHIGIEASGAVFDMAQKIEALGHKVSIINPSQFRAIGITGKKNDKNDAEALATALRLGFIPEVHKKSLYSRRLRSLLTSRDFIVKARVGISCHIRGILREYGSVIPQGNRNFWTLVGTMVERIECDVIKGVLRSLIQQGFALVEEEKRIEQALKTLAGEDERIARLQTVPGVGLLTSIALVAAVDDVSRFSSAKKFASYLGITPRENSSGNKVRFGSITKCGPEMLRRYLIHGARTVFRYKEDKQDAIASWARRLEKRSNTNKAVVALAHKNARICYAILRDGVEFRGEIKKNRNVA